MKTILSLFFILILFSSGYAQSKKRDKVKRKYRDAEATSPAAQPVYVRGAVYDEAFHPLPGATVTIDGTAKGVNTNEDGQYLITGLVSGRARVRVSFIGYKTRTADIILRPGKNEKSVMLLFDDIHLEPLTVSTQKHEQQILDASTAVTSISENTLQQSNITDVSLLSDFVPGLSISKQGANHTNFVLRGMTSEATTLGTPARVAVYSDNIPLSPGGGTSLELYDMNRIEVARGLQNTMFGRGAQAGTIHYISNMPTSDFYGSISAGLGDFNQQEVRGFVNIPVLEDKLMLRAAGIYDTQDGYIKNTFGGKLMGKETVAGRFSVRFRPAWNHRIDLILSYQKDDTPGIAFINDSLSNTEGVNDIFSGTASLEQGENLGSENEIANATLNYRFYIDENNYWTLISSYRKNDAYARWDGDGTALAAIDRARSSSSGNFFQEIRGNFSNSRTTGVLGLSYWRETTDQTDWFSSNEEELASLSPTYADATTNTAFSTNLLEESYSEVTHSSIQGFLDVSHQLSRKLFVSGGIRASYDQYKLGNEASITTNGVSWVLDETSDNMPKLLFYPSEWRKISKNTLSLTYRAGLKYRFSEYGNIYANYSHGRQPNVIQFSADGEKEVLAPETQTNVELGIKGTYFDRVFIDVTGFYQAYQNFQTPTWEANADSTINTFVMNDTGKATLYGAEASVRVAVLKQLDIFANYAWLHSQFDSTDVEETAPVYAGNLFRKSPEHCFTIGFNASVNITPTIKLFVVPSYAYKTHLFFDDINTTGFAQDAYGVLNINGGLELARPNIILSVWARNVLDEQYITNTGNTGAIFGISTWVPGSPQMIGTKLTWNFSKKKKRRARIFK